MYLKDLFAHHPDFLRERFLVTEVEQLNQAIPFDELVKLVPPPRQSLSGQGCKPRLDVKGGIALQFLKHHLRVSDAQLVEHLNNNWALQYFCGIRLGKDEIIKDQNLPGSWRSYRGKYLDIPKWQKQLAEAWKGHMQQT